MHGIQISWNESISRLTLSPGITASPYLDANGVVPTIYYYPTVYYYQVSAVLGGIEGPLSAEVSATFPTVPVAPSSVQATAV